MIDKKDQTIAKMKEIIDKEFEMGRIACISDLEMKKMLNDINPELYKKLKNREY